MSAIKKISKPVLVLDCDDVLAQWVKSLYLWYNKTYGTSFQYTNYTIYPAFREIWGVTQAEAVERVNRFAEEGHLIYLDVVDGAFDALTVLVECYELHVVTARSDFLDQVTREYIERHFQGLITDVHFANHNEAHRREKHDICNELNAVAIVDDSPENILGCAAVVENAILFRAPWNINMQLPSNGYRVTSWAEIVPLIML